MCRLIAIFMEYYPVLGFRIITCVRNLTGRKLVMRFPSVSLVVFNFIVTSRDLCKKDICVEIIYFCEDRGSKSHL